MLKKSVSWFCVVCLVASMFSLSTASAENSINKENLKILQGLNIVPTEVKNNESVKRGVFAAWFSGIYTNDVKNFPTTESKFTDVSGEYKNAVNILENYGLIDGSENKFNTRKTILFEDAVKIAVTALGYNFIAENSGGYPNGYIKVASDIKLLNNVECRLGEGLRTQDAVNLLYNCININVLEQQVFGVNEKYGDKNGVTLLAKYRNIYWYKGVVTGNCDTTLYAPNPLSNGKLQIESKIFNCENADYNGLLGKYVIAYYENVDDENNIVCLSESKNSELVLDDGVNVAINKDFSQLTYDDIDTGRQEKISLSPVLSFIYNGVSFGDYKASDFHINSGNLRFIDNNKDDEYDVLFVTNYDTMVVSYKSLFAKTITGKYTYNGALTSIDVEENAEKTVNIYKGTEKISIAEINEFDILSLAKSKSASKQITNIYVASTLLEGKLTSTDLDNNQLFIDEKPVKINYAYKMAMWNNDKYAQKLQIGETYSFYSDIMGKIAFAKSKNDSALSYVYLFNIVEKSGISSKVSARILTDTNQWKTVDFAEKIKLNKGDKTVKSNMAYKLLTKNDNCIKQLIKVKFNGKNEISELETAQITDTYMQNTFTVTNPKTNYYKYQNESFDSAIFVTNNTKVFAIPEGIEDIEENYSVKNKDFLRGDHIYDKYQAYDFDEYNFTDVILVRQTPSEIAEDGQNRSIFVVDKVTKGVFDGEPKQKLLGSMGTYRSISLIAEKDGVLDGLSRGDIIFINMNQKGNISSFTPIYRVCDGIVYQNRQVNGNVSVASGVVQMTDPVKGRMKLSTPNDLIIRTTANTAVTIYNVGSKSLSYGTVADVEKGDFVFARMVIQSPREVVVIRFK